MGSKERREREREQRRAEILKTAREILFKKGIDATSINAVARKAELSVGTIYLYFENKEALLAALQEEGLDLLYDCIRQAEKSELSPRGKLRAMGLAYLEFSERHRKYFDVINYFLVSPKVIFSPVLKARVDEHVSSIITLVEEVMGGDKTACNGRDRRLCAFVFCTALHGILQFKKLRETVLGGEEFCTFYSSCLENIIDGMH